MSRPSKSRNKLLKPSQAIHALHPEVPKNEVIHALRERVKELTALHSTVCVLQDDRLSTREALDRIVRLIPPAWQYPEITAGRIIVGDCETRNPGFRRTRWLQACDFRITREVTGRIEVYYLKKMPKEAEGPFLAEERNLINSLADMLRTYFARKLASQALLDAHNDLEKRVRERTAELEKLNAALKAEVKERELRQKEILLYQEKLRGLSSELILTEERERHEIATDLHDVIGQTLAMAKMKAGALRGACSARDAAAELKNLSGFIDEAIFATRNLTFQLASPILYELGLESALERLAEDTRRRNGLAVDFRGEGGRMPLPTETSVLIFKAVRELLMNAVKHSKASRVKVRVRRAAGKIAVTVRDNGRGFNAAAASVYDGDKGGFGLFSIREKVSRLGGEFRLNSRPGSGTLAVITAPLAKEKR
ncbi:MAG: sensor histidine kinase [Elusimicrobia bacterium]|nr:sensor histidine kinase [Elusimicrobiota bacterium]